MHLSHHPLLRRVWRVSARAVGTLAPTTRCCDHARTPQRKRSRLEASIADVLRYGGVAQHAVASSNDDISTMAIGVAGAITARAIPRSRSRPSRERSGIVGSTPTIASPVTSSRTSRSRESERLEADRCGRRWRGGRCSGHSRGSGRRCSERARAAAVQGAAALDGLHARAGICRFDRVCRPRKPRHQRSGRRALRLPALVGRAGGEPHRDVDPVPVGQARDRHRPEPAPDDPSALASGAHLGDVGTGGGHGDVDRHRGVPRSGARAEFRYFVFPCCRPGS